MRFTSPHARVVIVVDDGIATGATVRAALQAIRDILYGCGDFINDYEGIPGYEEYRGELAPMYLPEVNEAYGTLSALTIVLFRMRRFRLGRASLRDVRWFQSSMNSSGQRFASLLSLNRDASLSLVQARC